MHPHSPPPTLLRKWRKKLEVGKEPGHVAIPSTAARVLDSWPMLPVSELPHELLNAYTYLAPSGFGADMMSNSPGITTAAALLRSTYVSYSKLKTYSQCPMRFGLEYLDGCHVKPSKEMQIGSLVHAIVARYLKEIQGRSGGFEPTIGELRSLIESVSTQLLRRGEIGSHVDEHKVIRLLQRFPQILPRIDGRSIAGVEVTKDVKVGSWMLKSILDLVLTNSRGDVHIVDFKTGKPTYVDDLQLRIYALPILWAAGANIPGVRLTFAFLLDGSLRTIQMSRSECRDVEGWIVTQVGMIEADTIFKPKESYLCRWCGVRRSCPTYDSDF